MLKLLENTTCLHGYIWKSIVDWVVGNFSRTGFSSFIYLLLRFEAISLWMIKAAATSWLKFDWPAPETPWLAPPLSLSLPTSSWNKRRSFYFLFRWQNVKSREEKMYFLICAFAPISRDYTKHFLGFVLFRQAKNIINWSEVRYFWQAHNKHLSNILFQSLIESLANKK